MPQGIFSVNSNDNNDVRNYRKLSARQILPLSEKFVRKSGIIRFMYDRFLGIIWNLRMRKGNCKEVFCPPSTVPSFQKYAGAEDF
jgi:hypothetical protein